MQIVIGAKRESDFTDPIGMLSDCHRRIERFLEVLAAIATQAQGGPLAETQRAAFETALRYFREAAPKHTADEEESLFPRLHSLNRPGLSALLARIEDLSQDHVRAEMDHQEVDRLGQSWLANGQLSVQEASQLVAVLARLRKLHQSHIAIEDNEVFPHAARLLSAVDRDAVGREMAFRRGLKAVPADSL